MDVTISAAELLELSPTERLSELYDRLGFYPGRKAAENAYYDDVGFDMPPKTDTRVTVATIRPTRHNPAAEASP